MQIQEKNKVKLNFLNSLENKKQLFNNVNILFNLINENNPNDLEQLKDILNKENIPVTNFDMDKFGFKTENEVYLSLINEPNLFKEGITLKKIWEEYNELYERKLKYEEISELEEEIYKSQVELVKQLNLDLVSDIKYNSKKNKLTLKLDKSKEKQKLKDLKEQLKTADGYDIDTINSEIKELEKEIKKEGIYNFNLDDIEDLKILEKTFGISLKILIKKQNTKNEFLEKYKKLSAEEIGRLLKYAKILDNSSEIISPLIEKRRNKLSTDILYKNIMDIKGVFFKLEDLRISSSEGGSLLSKIEEIAGNIPLENFVKDIILNPKNEKDKNKQKEFIEENPELNKEIYNFYLNHQSNIYLVINDTISLYNTEFKNLEEQLLQGGDITNIFNNLNKIMENMNINIQNGLNRFLKIDEKIKSKLEKEVVKIIGSTVLPKFFNNLNFKLEELLRTNFSIRHENKMKHLLFDVNIFDNEMFSIEDLKLKINDLGKNFQKIMETENFFSINKISSSNKFVDKLILGETENPNQEYTKNLENFLKTKKNNKYWKILTNELKKSSILPNDYNKDIATLGEELERFFVEKKLDKYMTKNQVDIFYHKTREYKKNVQILLEKAIISETPNKYYEEIKKNYQELENELQKEIQIFRMIYDTNKEQLKAAQEKNFLKVSSLEINKIIVTEIPHIIEEIANSITLENIENIDELNRDELIFNKITQILEKRLLTNSNKYNKAVKKILEYFKTSINEEGHLEIGIGFSSDGIIAKTSPTIDIALNNITKILVENYIKTNKTTLLQNIKNEIGINIGVKYKNPELENARNEIEKFLNSYNPELLEKFNKTYNKDFNIEKKIKQLEEEKQKHKNIKEEYINKIDNIKTKLTEETNNEKITKLEKEEEKINKKILELDKELDLIKEEIEYFKSIQNFQKIEENLNKKVGNNFNKKLINKYTNIKKLIKNNFSNKIINNLEEFQKFYKNLENKEEFNDIFELYKKDLINMENFLSSKILSTILLNNNNIEINEEYIGNILHYEISKFYGTFIETNNKLKELNKEVEKSFVNKDDLKSFKNIEKEFFNNIKNNMFYISRKDYQQEKEYILNSQHQIGNISQIYYQLSNEGKISISNQNLKGKLKIISTLENLPEILDKFYKDEKILSEQEIKNFKTINQKIIDTLKKENVFEIENITLNNKKEVKQYLINKKNVLNIFKILQNSNLEQIKNLEETNIKSIKFEKELKNITKDIVKLRNYDTKIEDNMGLGNIQKILPNLVNKSMSESNISNTILIGKLKTNSVLTSFEEEKDINKSKTIIKEKRGSLSSNEDIKQMFKEEYNIEDININDIMLKYNFKNSPYFKNMLENGEIENSKNLELLIEDFNKELVKAFKMSDEGNILNVSDYAEKICFNLIQKHSKDLKEYKTLNLKDLTRHLKYSMINGLNKNIRYGQFDVFVKRGKRGQFFSKSSKYIEELFAKNCNNNKSFDYTMYLLKSELFNYRFNKELDEDLTKEEQIILEKDFKKFLYIGKKLNSDIFTKENINNFILHNFDIKGVEKSKFLLFNPNKDEINQNLSKNIKEKTRNDFKILEEEIKNNFSFLNKKLQDKMLRKYKLKKFDNLKIKNQYQFKKFKQLNQEIQDKIKENNLEIIKITKKRMFEPMEKNEKFQEHIENLKNLKDYSLALSSKNIMKYNLNKNMKNDKFFTTLNKEFLKENLYQEIISQKLLEKLINIKNNSDILNLLKEGDLNIELLEEIDFQKILSSNNSNININIKISLNNKEEIITLNISKIDYFKRFKDTIDNIVLNEDIAEEEIKNKDFIRNFKEIISNDKILKDYPFDLLIKDKSLLFIDKDNNIYYKDKYKYINLNTNKELIGGETKKFKKVSLEEYLIKNFNNFEFNKTVILLKKEIYKDKISKEDLNYIKENKNILQEDLNNTIDLLTNIEKENNKIKELNNSKINLLDIYTFENINNEEKSYINLSDKKTRNVVNTFLFEQEISNLKVSILEDLKDNKKLLQSKNAKNNKELFQKNIGLLKKYSDTKIKKLDNQEKHIINLGEKLGINKVTLNSLLDIKLKKQLFKTSYLMSLLETDTYKRKENLEQFSRIYTYLKTNILNEIEYKIENNKYSKIGKMNEEIDNLLNKYLKEIKNINIEINNQELQKNPEKRNYYKNLTLLNDFKTFLLNTNEENSNELIFQIENLKSEEDIENFLEIQKNEKIWETFEEHKDYFSEKDINDFLPFNEKNLSKIDLIDLLDEEDKTTIKTLLYNKTNQTQNLTEEDLEKYEQNFKEKYDELVQKKLGVHNKDTKKKENKIINIQKRLYEGKSYIFSSIITSNIKKERIEDLVNYTTIIKLLKKENIDNINKLEGLLEKYKISLFDLDTITNEKDLNDRLKDCKEDLEKNGITIKDIIDIINKQLQLLNQEAYKKLNSLNKDEGINRFNYNLKNFINNNKIHTDIFINIKQKFKEIKNKEYQDDKQHITNFVTIFNNFIKLGTFGEKNYFDKKNIFFNYDKNKLLKKLEQLSKENKIEDTIKKIEKLEQQITEELFKNDYKLTTNFIIDLKEVFNELGIDFRINNYSTENFHIDYKGDITFYNMETGLIDNLDIEKRKKYENKSNINIFKTQAKSNLEVYNEISNLNETLFNNTENVVNELKSKEGQYSYTPFNKEKSKEETKISISTFKENEKINKDRIELIEKELKKYKDKTITLYEYNKENGSIIKKEFPLLEILNMGEGQNNTSNIQSLNLLMNLDINETILEKAKAELLSEGIEENHLDFNWKLLEKYGNKLEKEIIRINSITDPEEHKKAQKEFNNQFVIQNNLKDGNKIKSVIMNTRRNLEELNKTLEKDKYLKERLKIAKQDPYIKSFIENNPKQKISSMTRFLQDNISYYEDLMNKYPNIPKWKNKYEQLKGQYDYYQDLLLNGIDITTDEGITILKDKLKEFENIENKTANIKHFQDTTRNVARETIQTIGKVGGIFTKGNQALGILGNMVRGVKEGFSNKNSQGSSLKTTKSLNRQNDIDYSGLFNS